MDVSKLIIRYLTIILYMLTGHLPTMYIDMDSAVAEFYTIMYDAFELTFDAHIQIDRKSY